MDSRDLSGVYADRDCSTCYYEFSPCPPQCQAAEQWRPKQFTPVPIKAVKHDVGKPRYDLIPPEVLDGLARLLTAAEGDGGKYPPRNWVKGLDYSRLYAAMQRHANAWNRGEDYAPDDGQHHLLSVISNAMMLYVSQARGIGRDDREKLEVFNPDFWRSRKPTTG